jgi:ubiquinone/menaquinone biosynthesis C-methylase UbiE
VRGFEQIPWLYDACCTLLEAAGFSRWRRWVVSQAHGLSLDLGTGTGRNLPLFGPATRVIGIDPYRPVLDRARRRATRARLIQAEAERLPFRDQVFDTVVSGTVLCSVADPVAALHEVRRVLRPGGTVPMLEHVRSTRPWKARVQDALQPMWTRVSGGCHPNRDTERAVREAGFVIEPGSRRARGDLRRFVAHP